MATYDETLGGGSGFFHQLRSSVWQAIDIVVADIIAAHATLTTNAKITAADVIQIYDIPAGSFLTGKAVLETIVAGTAGQTFDISSAEDDYLFNGVAGDSAVGTMTVNLVGDDWGADSVQGVTFAATDTLDCKFVADEIIGHWVLWLEIVNLSKVGQVDGY